VLWRRWLARHASGFVTYGLESASYLAALGVPTERVIRAQNFVDEAPFGAAGPAADLGLARPILLCVGQLVPRKGLSELLDALARASSRGLRPSLAVAGDGPLRGELEARARAASLTVRFLGWQREEQIAAALRGADCLVFPTLEDVWGLVVNEALLAGTPVIASRHAGCAVELVPLAQRFDPRDPTDFDRVISMACSGALVADATGLWPAQRSVEAIRLGLLGLLRSRGTAGSSRTGTPR
jgi:glycosyltransferase involved in cell wall biosynthesis